MDSKKVNTEANSSPSTFGTNYCSHFDTLHSFATRVGRSCLSENFPKYGTFVVEHISDVKAKPIVAKKLLILDNFTRYSRTALEPATYYSVYLGKFSERQPCEAINASAQECKKCQT